VEISKGSKVKYELDKKTGLIKVSQPVTISDLSVSFHAHCSATQLTRAPAVRSTACCTRRWCTRTTTASSRERFARTTTPWMCWSQEPVLPGCFLRARAIGLMPMIDQVCPCIFRPVVVEKKIRSVCYWDSWDRERRMTRSLPSAPMTPSTATTMTSASSHLTGSRRSDDSSKIVSFPNVLPFPSCFCCSM